MSSIFLARVRLLISSSVFLAADSDLAFLDQTNLTGLRDLVYLAPFP